MPALSESFSSPLVRSENPPGRAANFKEIYFPHSMLLAIDGARDVFNPYMMAPFLSIPNQRLVENGGSLRGSSLSEMFRIVDSGSIERYLFRSMMPNRFRDDVASQRLTPLERSLVGSLFEGSDYDFRIPVEGLADMRIWGEELKNQLVSFYGSKATPVAGRRETYEIDSGRIILCQPSDYMFVDSNRLNLLRYVHFQVESGVWAQNSIPFVNLHIIGRPSDQFVYQDLRLLTLSYAPTPSSIPRELRQNEDRTSNKVNDKDRILARVTHDIPEHFLYPEYLPLSPTQLPDNSVNRINSSGVVAAAIKGEWVNNRYLHLRKVPGLQKESSSPVVERVRRMFFGEPVSAVSTNPEMFIHLSADNLKKLSQPVEFGPDFGEGPAINTFQEALRVIRKGINHGIVASEQTERAFRLISSSDFAYSVNSQKPPNWFGGWELKVTRELVVMLFFAPKEVIALGNSLGFEQYFPQWNFLKELMEDLPSLEEKRAELLVPFGMKDKSDKKYDGLSQVIDLVRHRHGKNEKVKDFNDLQLILWLASTRRNPNDIKLKKEPKTDTFLRL